MNILKGLLKSRLMWIATCVLVAIGIGTTVNHYSGDQTPQQAVVDEGSTQEVVQTTTDAPAASATESEGPVYTVEKDESNTKLAAGHLSNGVRVGTWELFHRNGKLESTGEYVNGVRVGTWRFFFPTGELRSEGRFDRMGKKIGLWTTYYHNGEVSTEGKYVDGLRTGRWYAYLYRGHPGYYWVGHFNEKGQRDRDWTWHINGKAVLTDTYEDGKKLNREEHSTVRPASQGAAKPSLLDPEFSPPVIETANTNTNTNTNNGRQFFRRRWR